VLIKGLEYDGAGILRPSKVTAKTRFGSLLRFIRLFFVALVCYRRLLFPAQGMVSYDPVNGMHLVFALLPSPVIALSDE